ncbi:hypothetical protein QUA20_05780, partial [Microcoleus sp. Pol7_A1]|uniref:hypothetical protein n=1 Tax=Microcoleus sp. Pol7_A1 TaxID=2818893 RepID=UPI002FCEF716
RMVFSDTSSGTNMIFCQLNLDAFTLQPNRPFRLATPKPCLSRFARLDTIALVFSALHNFGINLVRWAEDPARKIRVFSLDKIQNHPANMQRRFLEVAKP